MIRKILLTVGAFLAIHGAQAQGIPTYDNVANLQWVQQLATTAQQLEQLKSQLQTMKSQFDSLNGLRDVSKLLNNQLLSQFLTPDQQALLNAIKSGNLQGSLSSISGALKDVQQQNSVIQCASQSSNQAAQALCNKRWQQAALGQYTGSQGYAQAAQNIDNLSQFLTSIQNSPDPKSLQDLQARIALEQVKQQNEASKLAMFKVMQDAQDRMDRMNAGAATNKTLTTGSGIRF